MQLYHFAFVPRYRRNLKAFYIVHPTLWARIVTWFFTTFTASSIKEKVHFLSGIQYLYDWIDPDQLDIPAFVLEYDMKVCTTEITRSKLTDRHLYLFLDIQERNLQVLKLNQEERVLAF